MEADLVAAVRDTVLEASSGSGVLAELGAQLAVCKQGLESGALQEALDADLKKVDSALDAARARLADYSGQHQQAIQTAQSEASALVSAYDTLDLSGIDAARADLEALRRAREQRAALLASQDTTRRAADLLQRVINLYAFEEALPAKLAEGRADSRVLSAMAKELAEMREISEILPHRHGKPPPLVKNIGPLIRTMAKKIRSAVRSLISRCLVLRSGAIQVRLERARAEGRGKAGEKKEGVGRSVWLGECLEALEWLAGHEDETGGRKVGGVGGGGAEEQLMAVVEGVEGVLDPLLRGEACRVRVDTREEEHGAEDAAGEGARGGDKVDVFELVVVMHGEGGGEAGARARADQCLGNVTSALEFVVERVFGRAGGGGKWLAVCLGRVWEKVEASLLEVCMACAPQEAVAFHHYYKAMSKALAQWQEDLARRSLYPAQGVSEKVAAVMQQTLEQMPSAFVQRLQARYVDRVRQSLLHHRREAAGLLDALHVVGEAGADGPAAGAANKGTGRGREGDQVQVGAHALAFPQSLVSSCVYGADESGQGVLVVLEEMVTEAAAAAEGEAGEGEVVPGIQSGLFQGTRMVVESYLALSVQVFADKITGVDALALVFHNDAMFLAHHLAALDLRWRQVLGSGGGGAHSTADLASHLRMQAAVYVDGVVQRHSQHVVRQLSECGNGSTGSAAFDQASSESLQDAVQQCVYQLQHLASGVLWPKGGSGGGGGAGEGRGGIPLVPPSVYRRIMASLIHCLYSELVLTVLSIGRIPPKMVKVLQAVISSAKVDDILKTGADKMAGTVVRAYVPAQQRLSMLIDLLGMTLPEFQNLIDSQALTVFTPSEVRALLLALFPDVENRRRALCSLEVA